MDALFNIQDDPMEKINVLSENPEQEQALRSKLNQWLKQVSAKMSEPAVR